MSTVDMNDDPTTVYRMQAEKGIEIGVGNDRQQRLPGSLYFDCFQSLCY